MHKLPLKHLNALSETEKIKTRGQCVSLGGGCFRVCLLINWGLLIKLSSSHRTQLNNCATERLLHTHRISVCRRERVFASRFLLSCLCVRFLTSLHSNSIGLFRLGKRRRKKIGRLSRRRERRKYIRAYIFIKKRQTGRVSDCVRVKERREANGNETLSISIFEVRKGREREFQCGAWSVFQEHFISMVNERHTDGSPTESLSR